VSAVVTVLMPLRAHHPPFLRKALDSIRGQDSPRWELGVIVEPENRDRFATLLASDLEDERVRLVANLGRGLGGAINTGMKTAGTEFVALLLADDMWAPAAVRVLGEQIAAFREVDFFHSSRQAIDEHDRPLGSVWRGRPEVRAEDFFVAAPVKHLLCWRRSRGLAIGGLDESLNLAGTDDYDFPWRMAEDGATFRAIPDCLYLYRDHRESWRMSTHPLGSERRRQVVRMWRKHGARGLRGRAQALRASRMYRRQRLYRSRLDRWLKLRRGFDARQGWRQPRL
jgi:O-antigen biosynthesis protein